MPPQVLKTLGPRLSEELVYLRGQELVDEIQKRRIGPSTVLSGKAARFVSGPGWFEEMLLRQGGAEGVEYLRDHGNPLTVAAFTIAGSFSVGGDPDQERLRAWKALIDLGLSPKGALGSGETLWHLVAQNYAPHLEDFARAHGDVADWLALDDQGHQPLYYLMKHCQSRSTDFFEHSLQGASFMAQLRQVNQDPSLAPPGMGGTLSGLIDALDQDIASATTLADHARSLALEMIRAGADPLHLGNDGARPLDHMYPEQTHILQTLMLETGCNEDEAQAMMFQSVLQGPSGAQKIRRHRAAFAPATRAFLEKVEAASGAPFLSDAPLSESFPSGRRPKLR